ncbi:hypothetical protein A4X13_0g8430, partial [Tilletia indica]
MSASNALIDLIVQAQQAAIVSNSPGLRLFGYHSNPTHNIAFAPHAFWTAFTNATSQTLQELFIDSYHSFEGTFLSGISFPDLKRCELKIPGNDLHGAIQNFLSRHLTLEHLCITQTRGYLHPTHISLPQTLPSLRSLTLRKTIIGSNTALRDFAVRHPQLERLKVSDKHSSFSSGEGRLGDSSYHLAQILKSQSSPDPRFFDEVASQGGSVAHIELLEADSKSTSTLGEFMSSSWLHKAQNAQAARAVTCLELVFSNTSLFTYMVDLDKAFESSRLPNLTELYLSWGKAKLEEKHFSSMLNQLCTATSLRILRLDASVRASLRKSPDIFFGHTFPAALEYPHSPLPPARDQPHTPTAMANGLACNHTVAMFPKSTALELRPGFARTKRLCVKYATLGPAALAVSVVTSRECALQPRARRLLVPLPRQLQTMTKPSTTTSSMSISSTSSSTATITSPTASSASSTTTSKSSTSTATSSSASTTTPTSTSTSTSTSSKPTSTSASTSSSTSTTT